MPELKSLKKISPSLNKTPICLPKARQSRPELSRSATFLPTAVGRCGLFSAKRKTSCLLCCSWRLLGWDIISGLKGWPSFPKRCGKSPTARIPTMRRLLSCLSGLFVCVGLVAYPLGLLTACMGASYMLRFCGRPSTIAECLKIVLPKSWTLWIFSWLDGWWTMERILERLPKKNDRTPLSVKLANEAVYQAWKISSMGFCRRCCAAAAWSMRQQTPCRC